AFLDHPARVDDSGSAAIVDRSGARKTLSPLYASAWGLAWSPKEEIWFTAASVGGNRSLYGVTKSERTRVLSRVTGSLTLQDISRDGRVLMAHDVTHIGILALVRPASNPQAVLYPTGAGEPRRLPAEGLNVQTGADWLPDGRRVLLTANEPGRGSRLYLQDLSGGKPRAISPEGYRAFGKAVSPDGKTVAVLGPDQRIYLYPVEGGEPAAIPGLSAGA